MAAARCLIRAHRWQIQHARDQPETKYLTSMPRRKFPSKIACEHYIHRDTTSLIWGCQQRIRWRRRSTRGHGGQEEHPAPAHGRNCCGGSPLVAAVGEGPPPWAAVLRRRHLWYEPWWSSASPSLAPHRGILFCSCRAKQWVVHIESTKIRLRPTFFCSRRHRVNRLMHQPVVV
jgi:hypothetical protein